MAPGRPVSYICMPWVRLSPTKLTCENQLFSTGAVRGSAAMRKSSAVVVPVDSVCTVSGRVGAYCSVFQVLSSVISRRMVSCRVWAGSRCRRFHITPTAPSSRYSRSCPCARRSMKRKTAKPAAMQYRMSSADVRRGSRRRKARSRSYSSAAAMPSRIA